MDNQKNPRATASLVAGLIIVAVGVILLLDRLGVIDGWSILRYWPLLLVFIGLAKLLSAQEPAGRLVGGILTAAGVLIQLHILGYVRLHWDVIWPIFVIAIGLAILWAALSGRRRDEATMPSAVSRLNEWVILGGGKLQSNTTDFLGGELFSMFGGFEVDLSKADMQQPEAVLNVTAIFGGMEIRVPESWNVTLKGVPILGGFDDKTYHPKLEQSSRQKRLIVKGFALFGGVEIKN